MLPDFNGPRKQSSHSEGLRSLKPISVNGFGKLQSFQKFEQKRYSTKASLSKATIKRAVAELAKNRAAHTSNLVGYYRRTYALLQHASCCDDRWRQQTAWYGIPLSDMEARPLRAPPSAK
jgi:hypothetical protein